MGQIERMEDRIRAQFQALGYWKNDHPDVRRFCEERGYTSQYVYGWLHGRRPSLSYVTRLAADLGVSVEWLAFGSGDRQGSVVRNPRGTSDATADPDLPREADPRYEVKRGGREGGKIIEHPLARVGALMERLTKSEAELQSTVRAWKESEARFRRVFEDGPLGMVIFDPNDLVAVGVNQRFADLLGFAPSEIVGRHVADFCHPDDASGGAASIGKILSGDAPFVSWESRYTMKSGRIIWGDITSVIVRNDAGAPLYGVEMIQDVTERKCAEERLQSLVARVPVGLYRSTPEGRLYDVNPALVQILGYPDAESLMAINGKEFYVDLEERRRWVTSLRNEGVVLDFEKRMRRRDGTVIWARDSARAFHDGEGRVVGWEGALEDVTARRRAEEATRALADVGRELAGTLDRARTTERIATAVLGLLRVQRSTLFQVDRASRSLVCVAAAGAGDPGEWIGRTVPGDTGFIGRAVRDGKPAWSPDLIEDHRFTMPEWGRERVETEGFRSGLAMPLTAAGEVLGVLGIGDVRGRAYSDEELALLSAFADRATLALQNARLYEEAERRRREAEVLAHLAGTINASLDLGTILQSVTAGAKELCGADLARVALCDAASGAMVFRYWDGSHFDGYNALRIEPGKGSGGLVMVTGRPFRTSDYAADPRISKDYVGAARAEGIFAELVVPIRIGDRVEGLLYVHHRSARVFSDRDEAIMLRLADHAAIAIRNARLFEETERRRRTAESLSEVGRLLSQSLDPQEVGQHIVDSVRALLGITRASLFRLEPAGNGLRLVASSGDAPPVLEQNFIVPPGGHVVGAAVRERGPVTTPDVAADSRIAFSAEARARFAAAADRAVLAVPLLVKGRVIGALSARDRTGRIFDDEEVRLARTFADQAALALENARLFEEAERRRNAAQRLADIGRLVSESLEPAEVGQRIVDNVLELLDVRTAGLYELDSISGNLAALAVAGDVGPPSEWNLVLVEGTGVVGLAVRERTAVFTRDPFADPRIAYTPEVRARLASIPYSAVLALPLLVKGSVIGALGVGDRPGREFSEEEMRLAEAFADQAALALENARLFAEAQRQRDRLLAPSRTRVRPAQ